jgi:hypothetical protein
LQDQIVPTPFNNRINWTPKQQLGNASAGKNVRVLKPIAGNNDADPKKEDPDRHPDDKGLGSRIGRERIVDAFIYPSISAESNKLRARIATPTHKSRKA